MKITVINTMATSTEASAQTYKEKVPELRRKFLDEHYSSSQNYFDERDISRVKSDDYFVLQFINAKEGNVDKALKIMIEALKWRKSFGVNDLTEKDIPDEILHSEIMYVHGQDKKGAFTVFHRLKYYSFKGKNELRLGYFKMLVLTFEQHQRANPGTKITNVTSCKDVKLTQVDMDGNKFMIQILTTYYPDILENSYILHYRKIFETFWKMSRVLLGSVAKKYVFTSPKELTTYIDKEYLPADFGES